MDSSFGLLKFLFPQIPSLANAALWHTAGSTTTSSKWDLRTELTVHVFRRMMTGTGSKPRSISKVQATTLKDPGVKGKTWVATETMPAPKEEEEGLREAVFNAIEDMKPKDAAALKYIRPDLVDIEVEWTGFRPNAGKEERLPDIPEEEKYGRLMAEPSRTSDTTILYFHGGAYYLCDPSTHRLPCSRLAKETHGRVCSVRYRLAPQTAFPGQLLDAFMVYLSLLYPPSGSMHGAVPAKDIVFAGDSAGGNLVFALLQLLLQLHRESDSPIVRFHGKDVEVPLPAGAVANSGWFDLTRSMPSIFQNADYDYLPPPKQDDAVSRISQDAIWPVSPPRGDLFCDLNLLDHSLVSPLAAESWTNAPPIWLCTGQECLRDEDAILASRAAIQDVNVQFEEYEAMPHCFALVLPFLPSADRCVKSCAEFCRRCVEEPSSITTNGTLIYAKTGKEKSIPVDEASDLSQEEVRRLMMEAKERRIRGFEKAEKAMPKSAL